MAIRNGPLWDKVMKGAVCLGLFLAFWSVQWVIPDFYQELFRLSLAGDVDGLIDYISSFGIYAAIISIFMITVTDMTGLPSIPFLTVNGAIFGLVPGLIISWVGEVLGTELSFIILRTVLRRQAIHVISRHHLRNQLDKYSRFPTLAMARSIPYIPNVPFTTTEDGFPFRNGYRRRQPPQPERPLPGDGCRQGSAGRHRSPFRP